MRKKTPEISLPENYPSTPSPTFQALRRVLIFRAEDMNGPYRKPCDPRGVLAALAMTLEMVIEDAKAELEGIRECRAWRKQRLPTYRRVIKDLQSLGLTQDAEMLEAQVERMAAARKPSRQDEKAVYDNVSLQCRAALERYTRLTGDRLLEKAGEVLAQVNLSSSEVDAVKRRYERMPKEMKAHWKERRPPKL